LSTRTGFLTGTPKDVTLPSGSAAGTSQCLSPGDINADGYADIACLGASGVVYVVWGSADGLRTTSIQTVTLPPASGWPYDYMVPACDVNADGFADVLVVAYPGATNAALLYLGGAEGLAASPSQVLGQPGDDGGDGLPDFGRWMAALGDVNGDGYGDVAISDSNDVYIYYGTPEGLAVTPSVTVWFTDQFGGSTQMASLAGGGDLNGDGFCDVLVNGTGTNPTVWFGGPSGITVNGAGNVTSPQKTVTTSDHGYSDTLASVGDVNGDGIGDFANVSSALSTDVFYGSSGTFPTGPAVTLDMGQWTFMH
jgi:FG-GAP-like repeat